MNYSNPEIKEVGEFNSDIRTEVEASTLYETMEGEYSGSLLNEDRIGNTLLSKVFVAKTLKDACDLILRTIQNANKFHAENDELESSEFERMKILRELALESTDVLSHLRSEYGHILYPIVTTLPSLVELLNAPDSSRTIVTFISDILEIYDALTEYDTEIVEPNEIEPLARACIQLIFSIKPAIMRPCFSLLIRLLSLKIVESRVVLYLLDPERIAQLVQFVLHNSLNDELIEKIWSFIECIIVLESETPSKVQSELVHNILLAAFPAINEAVNHFIFVEDTERLNQVIRFTRIFIAAEQFFHEYKGAFTEIIPKLIGVIERYLSSNIADDEENERKQLENLNKRLGKLCLIAYH